MRAFTLRAGVAVACAILLATTGVAAAFPPSAWNLAGARSQGDAARVQRDLQQDEALGGHTLARHVGKTDEDLADRLRREPQISTASTYTDLETAQQVVAAALTKDRDRVDAWSHRSGARPNLVVNYQSAGRPIGRAIARGARVSTPCDHALVVLRWSDRHRRWYVLTSYPETRR